MKVFIFGSRGMLGHVMSDYFIKNTNYEVFTSSRINENRQNHYRLDVLDTGKVYQALDETKPQVIINCIGILNKHADEKRIEAFEVNGVFPHRLAKWADAHQAKVVQISTDCVFDGKRGNYTETDKPNGTSSYALSKRLGELKNTKHITIRTSIIGPELKQNGIGLFAWFMRQTGIVYGYKNARWNGVTTLQLAKATHALIESNLSGLFHITAPNSISKYELLKLFQSIFQKNDVTIIPVDKPIIDRTLKNTRTDFSFEIPDYKTMLTEMKDWMDRVGK